MRAQSHVVGFALMLGLGVIALGTLTVGVGTVIDTHASNADATRVADGMTETLAVTERTGSDEHRLTFAEGGLRTEQRTLRILENGSVIRELEVGVLVYERDDRRVAGIVGAVVRGVPGSAWLVGEPPITSSETNDVLVVGAPVVGLGQAVGGQGGVTARLGTNVSHTREALGTGTYAVAIETRTPGPFERYFEEQGAITTRQTFAGDDHGSIVAAYPGTREGYLVVHELNLEVDNG